MTTNNILNQLKEVLKDFRVPERDFLKIGKHMEFVELKTGEEFCSRDRICSRVGILVNGLLMAHYDTLKNDMNVCIALLLSAGKLDCYQL